MKNILLGLFSAVVLSASVGAASAAPFPVCVRGDTMDRDGDHTGATGAPKCAVTPSADRMATAHGSAPMSEFYGEYKGDHQAR
jgi:hypothetical protein